jgi:poly-gamma-glutamate synthesis protein (capsule biosynthesis protein)
MGLSQYLMVAQAQVIKQPMQEIIDIPEKTIFRASNYSNSLPVSNEEPIRILFVGDIMLGRYVESLIKKNGEEYPYERIAQQFNEADIVVGNLEGPVMKNHVSTPDNSVQFSFDDSRLEELAKHIDIVSLANNHTDDYGENAYTETKNLLKMANIASFGHPRTVDEQSVYRTTVDKHDFVFIGFNETYHVLNQKKANELITSERMANPNATIFVSIHWGSEYQTKSNATQQKWGRGFIDSGANFVIGHHPHVRQEIEEYNGGVIAYSLGNFIFDQYFSNETERGLMIQVEITERNTSYFPIEIQSTKSQPFLVQ